MRHACCSLPGLGCSRASPPAQSSAQPSAPTSTGKSLNILLVGASGMIGSSIQAEAVSRGHHVIAASRHPEKIKASPNVKAIKLDAADVAAFTAAAKVMLT